MVRVKDLSLIQFVLIPFYRNVIRIFYDQCDESFDWTLDSVS